MRFYSSFWVSFFCFGLPLVIGTPGTHHSLQPPRPFSFFLSFFLSLSNFSLSTTHAFFLSLKLLFQFSLFFSSQLFTLKTLSYYIFVFFLHFFFGSGFWLVLRLSSSTPGFFYYHIFTFCGFFVSGFFQLIIHLLNSRRYIA